MTKISDIQKLFLVQAKRKKRKLAIGIVRPEPEVVESVKKAAKFADLIVVGAKISGLNCFPTENDDEASHKIIELLAQGKIEGLVRGQVKDSYTYKIYKEKFHPSQTQFKLSHVVMAKEERWFVAPSCSNYNALTLDSKKAEIERSAQWLQDLGIKPTIGLTSTRRPTGRVGEFSLIEEIAQRCEETAKYLKNKGYDVKEYYIEYEQALWEGRNIIAPSLGMIGNTWVKALAYYGGWTWICTPFLDQGAYYDNAARNNKNFLWPIISTVAWINREKNEV